MKKLFTLLFLLASFCSFSQSTTLVISQVYGAGGNSGAVYNSDYVELHNISAAAISLNGYSIQYASATNAGTWTGVSPLPNASIPAGGYYLIQMSSTGTNGAPLPTPDYVSLPTIAMAAASGKVALVNGLTALGNCTDPLIVDLVGYGTANCSEGTNVAVLSATNAAFRNNNGCAETNNNANDFTLSAPLPRTSTSPVFICGGSTNPVLTAGTVVDFGSVVVGTNSTSQSFNLSGSNLTGAPGNITVTAPSTDFQVSNDNSTWGATTTIAYTGATLTSTPVYVRFTPQTAGPKSGNVTITGAGVTTAVTVAVSGNGITAAVPTVTGSALATFGDVCVNTSAGPNSFTVNGTNLTTDDLTIAALNGFTFSTASTGPFTTTLTLAHASATYTGTVYVMFDPTAIASYNGNISISGGGLTTASTVPVTAAGVNAMASVTTGAASAITQNSATLAGTIPAQGCSAVTAYGFEYSLVSGFVNGTVAASTNISSNAFTADLAGLQPSTTYYYKAFATNSGGTSYGVEMSFTTTAPPPPTLSATSITGFGTICINTSAGPNSFDINGINLTTADITVGPLNGFSFATSATGTYTSTLTLTQGGGTFTKTIYVKFNPTSIGTFNGNIPVTGGGVSSFAVSVMASANNTVATMMTLDASNIFSNQALVSGAAAAIGCSPLITYGIEYSGINGFVNGSGTKVESANLNGTGFSSLLTGLVPGTTYYYKAYGINNGGIAYGNQNSFTTALLPGGLVIYSTPIIRGHNLHFSLTGVKRGHYSARIHNSVGQLVYQKDLIIQVEFIDDSFILPANLPLGLYNLEIRNQDYKIQRSFLVQ